MGRSLKKIRLNRRLQLLNQLRLHEFVVIRDVQANDLFTRQLRLIFLTQPAKVLLLHHKNQVSPANVARCNFNPGSRLSSGRAGLNSVNAMKDLFRSRTPPSVSAANEEQFFGMQAGYFSLLTSTFELRPLWSYFSRRKGGKSSGVPSEKPPLDWK